MTWEALVLFQMQVEANTNCTRANPGVGTGRWTDRMRRAPGEKRENCANYCFAFHLLIIF